MQSESQLCNNLKQWIIDPQSVPNKNETLKLDSITWNYLRHLSLVKLSDQGILFRLFLDTNGAPTPLVVCDKQILENISKILHETYGHINALTTFRI